MSSGQIIVLVSPVFFLLIALEYAWSRRQACRSARPHNAPAAYGLADALNSIGLGLLSQVSGVLAQVLTIGLYRAAYTALTLFPDSDFWTRWYGWLLALLFYDFCYYWQHRTGHRSALFWAAHVVHHQSQHYNLSTALRQPSTSVLLNWLFYLPMALAGVPPTVFAVVLLVDLLYQFWVHTEQIGRLGWFDRWFCAPSNHRVHHAVNDRYLDRNYGGILIVWDRLFGSFQAEDPQEACVYGTRHPLQSWDPLWANAEVYVRLAQDSWQTRRLGDKLRVWLKPPGWRPAGSATQDAPFDLQQVQSQPRYAPAMSATARWLGVAQFMLLLVGAALFLWHAHRLPLAQSTVCVAGLGAGLWAGGGLLQGRFSVMETLTIDAAVLSTLSAAAGLGSLYAVFKPLALSLAIACVALRATWQGAGKRFNALLLAALIASLIGDVLLLSPNRFVAGLLAFLIAHLAYIALFRLDAGRFFARRGALALTLALGVAMYALLWFGGLPVALRIPVAVYVLVIACMAAQAIGRAAVRGDSASRWVAVGACFFMLSDTLLAINRFVLPLPLESLWVLGSYYTAQLLIVRHARDGG